MTTTIELPDEQSATLLDSEELTNRQVKMLRRAARKVGMIGEHLQDLGLNELQASIEADKDVEPDEEATAEKNKKALHILNNLSDNEDNDLDLFQRTCVAVRLVGWTLDLPLPKTAEAVDDLPRPIFDVVTVEAAKLNLNESFNKEEGRTDPKVDTPESDDSSSPSAEDSP